jgi:hypothetical protein
MKYSNSLNDLVIIVVILLLWILFRHGKGPNQKLLEEKPLSATYQKKYSPVIYNSDESLVPKIVNKARLSDLFGNDELQRFFNYLMMVPMCDKGLFVGGRSADGWKVRVPIHINSNPGRIVAAWKVADKTTTTVMIKEVIEKGRTHNLCHIYNSTDPFPPENHILEAQNQISTVLWHFIATTRTSGMR